MRRIFTHSRTVSLLAAVFLLAGCASGPGPKATIGGLGGAAAGGLLAAAVGGNGAGIAAGTILGGLIGGTVGDRLDAADHREMKRAAMRALESAPAGESVAWRNPDSGNSGALTPVRTYQTPQGQYCREYQQTVTIGGREESAFGTACRHADGNWQVMS